MTLLEIEKTIKYSSFFGASLTLKELHLWLISPNKYSLKQVSSYIFKHPSLQKKLISKYDPKKTRLTKQKTKSIQKLISVLKCIPSIQLIALTGSLSIGNPKKYDDIDLMIITSPNTLWLTRPLVILLTSLLSSRRKPGEPLGLNNQVCINLWLDQTSLTVPKSKQNLYTAHEVLQTKPLFDRGGVHQQFIKANSWTYKHLATAHERKSPQGFSSDGSAAWVTAFLCGLLRGGTSQLNLLFFNLQYLYMKSKITNEYITPHSAYFHPRNLYPQIKTILQN